MFRIILFVAGCIATALSQGAPLLDETTGTVLLIAYITFLGFLIIMVVIGVRRLCRKMGQHPNDDDQRDGVEFIEFPVINHVSAMQ